MFFIFSCLFSSKKTCKISKEASRGSQRYCNVKARHNKNSVRVDTAFEFLTLKDTVTIYKDKLKVKMYTINDTVYVSAECKADTVEKII